MTFYVPALTRFSKWTDILIIYMKTDAEETSRNARDASLTADFVAGSVALAGINNYRRKTKIKQKKIEV